MKRLNYLVAILAIAIVPVLFGRAAGAADVTDVAALQFGTRDNVLDVGISPDGSKLVILQPNGARGAIASVVKTDGSPEMTHIISSDGNPQRLVGCRWASDSRIICNIYMIDSVYGTKMGATRMFAIDDDGGNLKQLSAKANGRDLGVALGGGGIIDWLGDKGDGSVLMQRWYIPEASSGHIVTRSRQGLGVEQVDTRSMARRMVETPNGSASEYITDGHGNVRIMGISPSNSLNQSRSLTEYRYRKQGSRDWLPLGTVTYSNYHATGFQPYAVDPDLNVVYGLEAVDGRTGLYKVALDGSLEKRLVFARPDAGISGLITIGRQNRVVGASWITDRLHAEMFDPELKAFAGALSEALPGAPNVVFVDASADEQKLVLFASSDIDPGRFYLYDKATRHLSEILPVRPLLAQTKLSPVKTISYPAADGTRVPAYLTLPPNSTGKNLPAIVLPHGGPSARDVWTFDWLPQYFAHQGYAVIQPNYRGSTGYGREWFQDNGIRSWRIAISDIDDAGRWLVQQKIADPARLAIVGWSYGGYAALQSQVVSPDLFKAVVAIAPVTDFGAVRDDAERRGGATPASLDAIFGDATTAEEGSPARHAGRFKAPVLLFHGDIDQNVAISQSRLMKDKLEDAGKPVTLIEYDGLDHQLDDSSVRADMLKRADAFLRASMKKK